MQTIFHSDRLKSRKKFQIYREMIGNHFMPIDCRQMGDDVFEAHLEAASIGRMTFTRATVSGQSVELTSEAASRGNKHDKLTATIRLSGTTRSSHNDRAAISHAGDMIVFDGRAPLAFEHTELASSVTIELPRERLESVLGPSSRYAGLTIGASLPETSLVRTYFNDLIGVHEELGPDIADRMAGIGADLIVAGVAARLAQDPPRDLQGNVTVQRAKAYASAHFGDPALDPAGIAAAVGVSLPRLQHLFHERGRDVSDWLWQRRLTLAARMLTDPRHAHLSIAALAESCGFLSPARFSRQFRNRFDVPPSEYRRASLQSTGRSAGGA